MRGSARVVPDESKPVRCRPSSRLKEAFRDTLAHLSMCILRVISPSTRCCYVVSLYSSLGVEMFALRSVVSKAAAMGRLATAGVAPKQQQFALLARYASTYFLDPKEVTDRVISVLNRFERIQDKTKINSTAHFNKDLGLDSLDTVELGVALEGEFGLTLTDAESEKLVSVPDAVEFFASNPNAK